MKLKLSKKRSSRLLYESKGTVGKKKKKKNETPVFILIQIIVQK